MRTSDSGVLILDGWFEALQAIPPKQYKQLVNSIYLVQRKGAEIPEFEGKSALLAKVIFPHVCNRTKPKRSEKSMLETVYGLDSETAKVQEILLRKTKEMKDEQK